MAPSLPGDWIDAPVVFRSLLPDHVAVAYPPVTLHTPHIGGGFGAISTTLRREATQQPSRLRVELTVDAASVGVELGDFDGSRFMAEGMPLTRSSERQAVEFDIGPEFVEASLIIRSLGGEGGAVTVHRVCYRLRP